MGRRSACRDWAPPGAGGAGIGPRTFETGAAACSGDSGSPAFNETTKGVFGVIARALNLDPLNPISKCAGDSGVNVYMVVADYDRELRAAFTAANAKPWLEGRDAPGFLPFGDVCSADLACEGNRCSGLSETASKGTCNVACTEAGQKCPNNLVCSPAGECATAASVAVPPAPPPAPVEEPETLTSSTCSANRAGHARSAEQTFPVALMVLRFGSCVARRSRLQRAP